MIPIKYFCQNCKKEENIDVKDNYCGHCTAPIITDINKKITELEEIIRTSKVELEKQLNIKEMLKECDKIFKEINSSDYPNCIRCERTSDHWHHVLTSSQSTSLYNEKGTFPANRDDIRDFYVIPLCQQCHIAIHCIYRREDIMHDKDMELEKLVAKGKQAKILLKALQRIKKEKENYKKIDVKE